MMIQPPIFVHAWWRSGSTYLWAKLRDHAGHCSYYEPLHERIAKLRSVDVMGSNETAVSAMLRHPGTQRHYFAEYADWLAQNSGAYSPNLAYRRYFLAPEEEDAILQRYLEELRSTAAKAGRRSVFCFCRSQMRSAWMKRQLGGVHIAQIRNPWDQWRSFQVNSYFKLRLLSIAFNFTQAMPELFGPLARFQTFVDQLGRRSLSQSEGIAMVGEEELLEIFLTIWIASTLQALWAADFVLDMDRLSRDSQARRQASEWFHSQGLDVDFADCSLPTNPGEIESGAASGIGQRVGRALQARGERLLAPFRGLVADKMEGLSPPSRQVLQAALT